MTSNKSLSYVLIGFGFLIALNAFILRYPADFTLPLIKAAGLMTGIFIYGFSINLLLKETDIHLVNAFAVGLIFTTLYFYIVSFLKLLTPVTVILFYLLPLPLLYFLITKKKQALLHTLRTFFNRPAKEYIIFLFPLIYASLPSSFYDTLVYHLGIPNLYLQHHGFIATPQFLFANTSIYYEISLIPAVFAGDMVPRLFHFLTGAAFLLFMVDFAVRFFQLKQRFILLLVLVSIPMSVFLLTTVKNDLLSALFILAGITYYMENKIKRSALFWGFAVGIKYFNALALVIFLVAVFTKDIKEKKINFKVFVIFGIIITVTLLPLFLKNYVLVKNPFFPFLAEQFPGEYFDASRYALMKADVGKTVHSLQELVKLPYTLSFYELGSGGIIGVIFLVFLPFTIFKKPKHLFLLVFSLLFLLAGSYFTGQVRFMYPAFVLLAVFVALVYESLDIQPLKIMKYLFFLIIGLNVITSFAYHERINLSYYLYSGKSPTVEEYKTEVFPSYPAIAYVNKNTPKDSNILLAGECRNYYLKRHYTVSTSMDYSILKKYLSAGNTFRNFTAALKKDNIHYIIYNSSEFNRLQNDYNRLTTREMETCVSYLNLLEAVYKDKTGVLYVYRII